MSAPEQRETRRKRLRFQAWHRGTKEMDYLLGTFADRHIKDLQDGELDALERLMGEADQDIFNWVCGREPVPDEHDSAVFRTLSALRFEPSDFGMKS